MDPPSSSPDAVANEDATMNITENDATEAKNENEDVATTTSTQPENSVTSNSSNGEGSDSSPAVVAAPATAASPTPPQDTPPAAASPSAFTPPAQPKTFVYDPNKITLKFIFANRDGLHVILDCTPADTVGEVKGALLSMWPDDIAECSDGERVRLICMGKGLLMPDSKSLESLDVPVFKTHATPVNVAVRPEITEVRTKSPSKKSAGASSSARGGGSNSDSLAASDVSTGCSCVIL